MKWPRWTLALIVVVLLLGCLGLAFPADLLIALTLGWAFYLHRVIPQVHLNVSGMSPRSSAWSGSSWDCTPS